MFRDYVTEKLIASRIKTLINEEADIGEVLLGIRKWIRRSTKPGKTDVYVFYADMELLPLAENTHPALQVGQRSSIRQNGTAAKRAVHRDRQKTRNVTIFLDACYTGNTNW